MTRMVTTATKMAQMGRWIIIIWATRDLVVLANRISVNWLSTMLGLPWKPTWIDCCEPLSKITKKLVNHFWFDVLLHCLKTRKIFSMKSIQLHESIEGLSQQDSILYIYIHTYWAVLHQHLSLLLFWYVCHWRWIKKATCIIIRINN